MKSNIIVKTLGKSRAVYLLIVIVLFCVNYWFLKDQFHSFHFGDETEHLTPGWMMSEYGVRLYEDLSTNHQPLPVLYGKAFNSVVELQNLFMYIQRLRQSMWLVSLVAASGVVWLLKGRGLVIVLLIEFFKFYLFGFHVLAESLVVYPVVLIVSIVTTRLFGGKKIWLEPWLMGLSLWVVFFNLAWLWPFVVLSLMIYGWIGKKEIAKVLLLFGVLTILLFTQFSPGSWWDESVINVWRYFLPFGEPPNYLKVLLLPFFSIFELTSILGRFIMLLCFPLLLSGFVWRKQLKNTVWLKLGLIYLLLLSLNPRVDSLNEMFYRGFHLLPWLSGFVVISLLSGSLWLQKTKGKGKYILAGLWMIALVSVGTTWWRESGNNEETFYIQYGEVESVGSILRVVKQKGDRLLAGELDGYLNITSGIPLADRQNAHLEWSYTSPKLRSEFEERVLSDLPAFIYYPPNESGYYHSLAPLLKTEYVRVKRSDGGDSHLYVLKERVGSINQDQLEYWREHFYEIPLLN